jgi:hypothetical protein
VIWLFLTVFSTGLLYKASSIHPEEVEHDWYQQATDQSPDVQDGWDDPAALCGDPADPERDRMATTSDLHPGRQSQSDSRSSRSQALLPFGAVLGYYLALRYMSNP